MVSQVLSYPRTQSGGFATTIQPVRLTPALSPTPALLLVTIADAPCRHYAGGLPRS
ncbi:hypothetical protein ARTHRO9AX_220033 [Arthrobacter sp. 9AX]|nr:hypothetical protein ARTHRO9AX_220033 [Arthrobacter sp. 9AX]